MTPKSVRDYYEILLLWEPFPYVDESGVISIRYLPPKQMEQK